MYLFHRCCKQLCVFSPFLTVMLFDPQKGPIVTKDLQTTNNAAAVAQGQPYYRSVMVCVRIHHHI